MTLLGLQWVVVALNTAPDRVRTLDPGSIAGDCVLLIAFCFVFAVVLRIASTLLLRAEAAVFSRLREGRSQPAEMLFFPGQCLNVLRTSARKIGVAAVIVVLAWTVARTGVGSVNLGVFEPVPSLLTWLSSALRASFGVEFLVGGP